jgi:hypothetical protein
VYAAARSKARLSGFVTDSKSEQKNECSVTVEYNLVIPPREQLGDDATAKVFEGVAAASSSLKQVRNYDTMHDEENGETIVELAPPPE